MMAKRRSSMSFMSRIGNNQEVRILPDIPTSDSPEVQGNPYFAQEDKVTLGERDGLLGSLGFHSKVGGLRSMAQQGYYWLADNSKDRYEPWPKDPKDDFEKQKRKEWLKTEI